MANWFITEGGEAVNLDMSTQIIIRHVKSECAVVALFACPSQDYEMKEGVDAFILKVCIDEDQAKGFIRELITFERNHAH